MNEQQTAAAPEQNRYCTTGDGVGMGGYDPVSYFPEGGGKPMKGFVLRATTHDGVTYRFASDANKALFEANPSKYLPAFGGWCAWAVGKLDKKVDVDPESYVIENNKVHLFYNHAELDTRADWLANHKDLAAKAEANWKTLDGSKKA